jgi:hypothetical protein
MSRPWTYHSLSAWSDFVHVDYWLATSRLRLKDICGVANEEVNSSSCFVLSSYRVWISLLRPTIMIEFLVFFSPSRQIQGWLRSSIVFLGTSKQNRAWSIPRSLYNLVLTMQDSRLSRRWCATVHSGGYHKRFEGTCCLFLRGRKLRHSEKERWHRGRCKMKNVPIFPLHYYHRPSFPSRGIFFYPEDWGTRITSDDTAVFTVR